MKTPTSQEALKYVATMALLLAAFSSPCFSQQLTFAMAASEAMSAPVIKTVQPQFPAQETPRHKFWDRENCILFTGVAATSAADFAVTYSNLQNGGRELNPITRVFAGSTAGLAANFAGETAGVIGLSYFFHKTGHHRLERVTSMVNISASSFAVGYGLSHR